MKLTATMMLTVDGVYQGPGGPDEDRRGGFDRGGWTAPLADEEGGRFLTSVFERADALLLGRKTWEILEPYWPHHDRGDPVSHGINVLPKYVPSTTLKDPAGRTRTSSTATSRRRCASSRRSPGASSRSMAAASCSVGCSSATSSTSSTCGSTRSWWATGFGCSRSGADAQPEAGRVTVDAVRRDDPDLSTGRAGDIRQRRGVIRAPAV